VEERGRDDAAALLLRDRDPRLLEHGRVDLAAHDPSSRSLELTVAAQVVIAARGIAPSSICRPAYAVPLP